VSLGRRLLERALAATVFVAAGVSCDRGAVETRGEAPAHTLAGDGRGITTSDVEARGVEEDAGRDEAPRTAAQPAARPARFVALGVEDDAWIARARRAESVRFKPVGTSSVVFKTTFVGGLEAAFRPRTRAQARGWTNELAAYRIARALGMDQVPPVVARSFARAELQERLDPEFVDDWISLNDKMTGRGDVVWGSLVYWVPGLRDVDLDTPRGMVSWSGWLAHDGGLLSADETSLAADVGTMVYFDYLIANVDRWSGGNVSADATGRRVIIRDHNLAFLSPLPRAQHERVLAHVRRVERFSRRFVGALRALDEARLRAALAEDTGLPEGTVLLDDAQVRELLDRRQTLLSRVAALLDAYGEDEVLALP
jgi:hypothetical protein